MANGTLSTPAAVAIFVVVLLAYTAQTELAQYTQQTIGYRKPFFLFYLTHSGYLLLAPLHLLVLRILRIPILPALNSLRSVLELQYAPPSTSSTSHQNPHFRPHYSRSLSRASLPPDAEDEDRPRPRKRASMRRLISRGRSGAREGRHAWVWRFARTVGILSVLIAVPALTWYAAVPLTSMTNITAIYNVFAFWAYLLAIKYLGEQPTRSKLVSVVVAVLGVFVIALGDSIHSEGESKPAGASPLLGNALAFVGSVSYAWYEVWYKINVALPDEEDDGDDEVDLADEEDSDTASPLLSPSPTTDAPTSPISHTSTLRIASPSPSGLNSTTTFFLHSSLHTSLIGFTTLFTFWVAIPVLHWLGWEPWVPPPSNAWLPIFGIITTGVAFNAGFMVLLSLWGPVVASVGNLCTLVLVALADTFVPTAPPLTAASWLGSGLIVASFAGLIIGAKREKLHAEREKALGESEEEEV